MTILVDAIKFEERLSLVYPRGAKARKQVKSDDAVRLPFDLSLSPPDVGPPETKQPQADPSDGSDDDDDEEALLQEREEEAVSSHEASSGEGACEGVGGVTEALAVDAETCV